MGEHPDELLVGKAMPANQGFEREGWLVEEDQGASRISIRFNKKLLDEQSEYQRIAVYETDFFGRLMTLDGLMMFTERDEFVYHEMLIHVPLCSLENPESVLIVGGGDAGCLREALKHPSIKRVVQCDIDEGVTRAAERYFPWVKGAIEDPRAEVLFADGVKYIQEHKNSFDLIVIDSTDPVGPAVGLFMHEFYAQVRDALKPGGIMSSQTESPHWAAAMMGAIHGEQRKAFKHVEPYLGFIPTYPSGCWSWGFASDAPRRPVDKARAQAIADTCSYYNPAVHEGAFAVPNFVRRAAEGENLFERFDKAHSAAHEISHST